MDEEKNQNVKKEGEENGRPQESLEHLGRTLLLIGKVWNSK